MLRILPVPGIGEVTPGADLAEMIAAAAPWLRDGDVLVVTSKIVSKAEGRLVAVPTDGPGRERYRQEAITAESARTVARRGSTRIVATHHGFVMAAAGVDASNVEPTRLVLLPKDPDASARALRAALAERYGRRVAVIVSDTAGRPWRNGLTDLALGAAGIEPLLDHRGRTDPYGNPLELTQMAVVDELAAAAELVKGKTDQVPVAVVRGFGALLADDGPGVVASLVRDSASDLFSLGTAEARAAGLRDAAALPDAAGFGATPVDAATVERVVAAVPVAGMSMTVQSAARARAAGAPAAVRCTVADPGDPVALVRLGAGVHRLRAALAAEGLASAATVPAAGVVLVLAGPPGEVDPR
jgi:coenzyme F420-0:L-glutamate ligase/coenzyme F420-1:gamma-L-glutamate ligase